MNFAEADALEPPRGSRAQVSLVVVAIDDHRPPALEPPRRLRIQGLQGDVDRAGKVLLLVLGLRQHLHELRALGEQALHLVPADRDRHHSPPAKTSPKTRRPASIASGSEMGCPDTDGFSAR